jgi:hypothetical protein
MDTDAYITHLGTIPSEDYLLQCPDCADRTEPAHCSRCHGTRLVQVAEAELPAYDARMGLRDEDDALRS